MAAKQLDLETNEIMCQLPCIRHIGIGKAPTPRPSLVRRFKLFVRRQLDARKERRFKAVSNDWLNRVRRLAGRESKPAIAPAAHIAAHIRAGDMVRVRSQEEIAATLNNWRQLKGCTFMPEMARYCGTSQRVLKPLERFVDERDLRVKKCSGVVLLAGVICEGTADFGRCDRSCFLFWREEWLEKVG